MDSILTSSSPSSVENMSRIAALRAGPPILREVRSPSASELDERASHRSLSLFSPSPGASCERSSSSEPFLYLESPAPTDQELDCEPRRHRVSASSSSGCSGVLDGVIGATSSNPPPLRPPKQQLVQNGSCSYVQKGKECCREGVSPQDLVYHGAEEYGTKKKRIKATKLRLYAKTSSPCRTASQSPSTTTFQSRPTSPVISPLIVSVSLSSLPLPSFLSPPMSISSSSSSSSSCSLFSTSTNYHTSNGLLVKQRRRTALSTFAMKKRALSRSPSCETSQSRTPSPVNTSESAHTNNRSVLLATDKLSKDGAQLVHGGVRKASVVQIPNSDTVGSTDKKIRREQTPLYIAGQKSDAGLSKPVEEDDKISLASSSATGITISSSSSIASPSTTTSSGTIGPTRTESLPKRGSGRRKYSQGSRSANRGKKSGDIFNTNSNFSLQSLFSYHPPTLTVRNGELVPEKSLSIKNFDRNDIPASHPIFNWQLGQPVRGRWVKTVVARGKRPRKASRDSVS